MAKKRITKVYTRTGDTGETSLVSGARVSKASPRVEAYGDVDELNAVLGMARQSSVDQGVRDVITGLQNDLFILGADLATPLGPEVPREFPRIDSSRVKKLEKLIDDFLLELEPLVEFILPGGSGAGPTLHLARTVSRRAERRIVTLAGDAELGPEVIAYVNRLSDLLFVLARIENKRGGFDEQLVDFKK